MNDTLNSAAGTAVDLGIFPSLKRAKQTLRRAKHTRLPVSLFKSGAVDNINPARLSKNPYPKKDRPRGESNLASVRFHRNTIRKMGQISKPVWVLREGNKLTMLDGVHRVVASYLEHKRFVPARVATRKVPKKYKRKSLE